MQKFDYNQVKNPEFFSDGCIPAHSDHVYYGSAAEYHAGKMLMRVSLNGMWKFSYARKYEEAVKGFESIAYDCHEWKEIKVPAHIQMEGYGVPAYVTSEYPWDGHEEIVPGEIPTRYNPTAEYVKYFEVPKSMQGSPLFLSFQGVESAFALWCNGEYVGYSEDSFTPSEFELTPYLCEGENKLAVQVFQWSSGSWTEDQDFYRFSGIFRDVYLYSIPRIHVFDLKAVPALNETLSQGKLDLTLKLRNAENFSNPLSGTVKVMLKTEGQETIYEETVISDEVVRLLVVVNSPRLWSAEIPNRYLVLIEVYDKDNQLCEIVEQYIGFRRFEIKDGLMLLNGKRIVFHGTNRHEFCADTGRVISRELMIRDIVIMKQNNINALRMSHYPNSSYMYELCDEYGIYVIDETNLETHGLWDACIMGKMSYSDIVPGDRTDWTKAVLKRAENMYERDKNHASILMWSCGNESFGGKNLYEISEYFRKMDTTRLVHYEGIYADRRYNNTSDVESQMYTPAADIEHFLKTNRDKPFICCEFMHSMGNANGAVFKYIELTEREQLFQGGFVWDFVDQTILKNDRYGNLMYAYGGDFDEHPNGNNFSGNGIVYADRRLSPKMQEIKYIYQNLKIIVDSQKFTVWNKFLFLGTQNFYCVVSLYKNGVLLKSEEMKTAVPPQQSMDYPIPFTKETIPGEYVIIVSFLLRESTKYAKKGHEIAFGQGIYKIDAPKTACTLPVTVVDGVSHIGVQGKDFEVLFDRRKFGLVSYRYKGKELIKGSLRPNFWRAPVDDDIGNFMPVRYAQWKIASMYGSLVNPENITNLNNVVLAVKDHCAVLKYTWYLPTTPVTTCQHTYTVYGDGTVESRLYYDSVPSLGDMPEFGILFKMDAGYDRLEWYGDGPEETYCDRRSGAKLGIYRNRVTDNMADYLVPQECGNKTGVRYAKITDAVGFGLLLQSSEMNFSALPYTPHELENAMHSNELPQIQYTVIRASLNQMGVGGDDAWGSKTHPEYLLDVQKPLEFVMSFCGIDESKLGDNV